MRYPAAVWSGPLPTTNYEPGGMGTVNGLVLHIEEGTEPGTDAWFHNPTSIVSAHFGNPKSGPLQQWVDTDDMAYAEVNGNPNWISVEHEGNSGDSLTASQIQNDAELLAWLFRQYGFTLQVCDDPSGQGVAGHVTGGAAWGNHLDCPGAPIMAQRQSIVDKAHTILHPATDPIMEVLNVSITDPEFAVRFLFRFCLHREADPGGFTTYVDGLNNGTLTLDQVMADLQDSTEGQAVIAAERKAIGI